MNLFNQKNKVTRLTLFFLLFGIFFLLDVQKSSSNIENKISDKQAIKKTADITLQQAAAPTEVIVKFKQNLKKNISGKINVNDTGISSINKKNKQFNVEAIDPVYQGQGNNSDSQQLGLDRVFKIKPFSQAELADMVAKYQADPAVEYAQPDYVHAVLNTPNDTLFSSQWALTKIKAPQAWDISTGSSSVTVAVVDTGVDYTHQDLASNIWNNPGETGMTQPGDVCWTGTAQDKKSNGCDDDGDGMIDDWHGWNFVDGNNDPLDQGYSGVYHGTHVAGIIGAVGNNAIGVSGVNWNVKIMPLRICDNSGCSSSDGAQAIRYAADHGAKVINNSWGGKTPFDSVLKDAIDYAHQKGALVINAAGNSSEDMYSFFPASIASGMAISASDSNDVLAGFSNWGAKVDVAAPGANILSTYPTNDYQSFSGTSMASPYAAGLAALIFSHSPSFTPEEVRQVMRSSADDLGSAGFDYSFGAGRINAFAALQVAAPLTAYISSPTSAGLDINGVVTITGSASGTNFKNYVLEYGSGSSPTTWTQITSSTTPVSNGTLATLDLGQLQTGTYVLRLTAYDQANKQYQFASYLNVLTSPTIPTSLNAIDNSATSILLNWTSSKSQYPIAGYQIYRSESADFSNPTIFTSTSVGYFDSSFQIGHTYFYKVRAYNNQSPAAYSDFSASIVVTRDNPHWIHKVSTKTGGGDKSYYTSSVSNPSADGRYVAFADASSDLVSGDTNGSIDVFVKDIATNITTRISVSSSGQQGDCDSNGPKMSADGRYVVFQSCASNLVANDTNGQDDIFIRDLQQNTTTLVSTNSAGIQDSTCANGCEDPSFSANGRYVTFTAYDQNYDAQVYRKDLQTGQTTLVSANATGTKGDNASRDGGISADGRYVAFDSFATNLVASNPNGSNGDIYLKDMQTGEVDLISVGAGNGGGFWYGIAPSVSEDGRYVVFTSGYTHLVTGQTTGNIGNVFLRDRQTGTTSLVSKSIDGKDAGTQNYNGKISSDGRYIVFDSDASNLVANDLNGNGDVFLYEVSTGNITILSRDLYGGSIYLGASPISGQFSYGGKYITFVADAAYLVPESPNTQYNAYIKSVDSYAGIINQLSITPSASQTIQAGQTVQFSAQGKDEYNTNIANLNYSWTGSDQAGLFNNTTAGNYQVKAAYGWKESTPTAVNVNPGALNGIVISPNTTQAMMVGQSLQFSAQGKDQYGNNIPGLNYVWSGTNASGLFAAQTAGNFQVGVSSGGISSDSVSISVTRDYKSDFMDIVNSWFKNNSPQIDYNNDGVENVKDLGIMMSRWN